MNGHPTPPRSCWRHTSLLAVASVAIVCAGPVRAELGAAQWFSTASTAWDANSLGPNDSWNTMKLEMTVTKRRVSQSGSLVGAAAPRARYRIERSSLSGQWKTTIVVLSVDRPPTYSLSGALTPRVPFPVARIVDEEDGTSPRAYDSKGKQLASILPAIAFDAGTTGLPRSSGREWIQTFIATTAMKSARQQSFDRQFGKATTLGQFRRYLRQDIDSSQEVLVEPQTVVPVESNALENGRLVLHRKFAYAPARDGAVVRMQVHCETVVSQDSGERAVTDATFSNIKLEKR